jgi:hypothetical protein
MARKPPALARELLRNFPKRRARNARRRRKGSKGAGAAGATGQNHAQGAGGNGRKPGGGRGRGRGKGAQPQSQDREQTPSDAVLAEALSSAPAAPDNDGAVTELAPGAGEQLQRNVEEALDHAEE